MTKSTILIRQELDTLFEQFYDCQTIKGQQLVGQAIVSKRKELYSALDKEKDTSSKSI